MSEETTLPKKYKEMMFGLDKLAKISTYWPIRVMQRASLLLLGVKSAQQVLIGSFKTLAKIVVKKICYNNSNRLRCNRLVLCILAGRMVRCQVSKRQQEKVKMSQTLIQDNDRRIHNQGLNPMENFNLRVGRRITSQSNYRTKKC